MHRVRLRVRGEQEESGSNKEFLQETEGAVDSPVAHCEQGACVWRGCVERGKAWLGWGLHAPCPVPPPQMPALFS